MQKPLEDSQRHKGKHAPEQACKQGHAEAACVMARKSSGFRLAPPTSAPSISDWPKNSAAFAPVTDPPYSTRIACAASLPYSSRSAARITLPTTSLAFGPLEA